MTKSKKTCFQGPSVSQLSSAPSSGFAFSSPPSFPPAYAVPCFVSNLWTALWLLHPAKNHPREAGVTCGRADWYHDPKLEPLISLLETQIFSILQCVSSLLLLYSLLLSWKTQNFSVIWCRTRTLSLLHLPGHLGDFVVFSHWVLWNWKFPKNSASSF